MKIFTKICNKVLAENKISYFCAVIKGFPIEKKRLAALFMLLLFLFIHGLKLFHTHEHEYPQDPGVKKELVSKSKHCDICDYHFAKDTIKRNNLFVFFKAQDLPVYFNLYQSRSIRSIGLSYSDRGPPVLI